MSRSIRLRTIVAAVVLAVTAVGGASAADASVSVAPATGCTSVQVDDDTTTITCTDGKRSFTYTQVTVLGGSGFRNR